MFAVLPIVEERPPANSASNDEAAANLSSLQFTCTGALGLGIVFPSMDLGPRGKRNQQIDCVLSTLTCKMRRSVDAQHHVASFASCLGVWI